jgi:hypothetical protein
MITETHPSISNQRPLPLNAPSTQNHLFNFNSKKNEEEPINWVRIAAYIVAAVAGIFIFFSATCIAKIFPPAFLGGNNGIVTTLATGFPILIGVGLILWVTRDSH